MGAAAVAPPPLAPGEVPVELLARCLVACDSATALAMAECVSSTWRAAARAAWPRVLAAHGGGDKDAYVSRRHIRRWLPGGANNMPPPAVLRGHTSAVLCCAQRFDAATGRTEFASGGADSHARVWRPPTNAASCAWYCDGPLRHAAPVTAVAFTLTGGALVTASGSSAFVWRSGVCLRRFGAAGPIVTAIALTHEELFCASVDGRLRVFDLLSGALLRELRPPGGAPSAALAVAVPPAPPLLASAGADGLRVGHADSAAPLPWAFDDCGAACAVALRQGDAAVAYVGRADGAVVRVCLRTGASLAPARLHHRATVTLHAPPDMPPGCVLVAGGAYGLALITPAATAVGHRGGDARLGLGTVRHLQGGYTGDAWPETEPPAAPDACVAQPQPSSSGAPAEAVPPAAATGKLRGAAGGPAWVVSAHTDGAVRAWLLPQVQDWEA